MLYSGLNGRWGQGIGQEVFPASAPIAMGSSRCLLYKDECQPGPGPLRSVFAVFELGILVDAIRDHAGTV
jgi:hypothetical protein